MTTSNPLLHLLLHLHIQVSEYAVILRPSRLLRELGSSDMWYCGAMKGEECP